MVACHCSTNVLPSHTRFFDADPTFIAGPNVDDLALSVVGNLTERRDNLAVVMILSKQRQPFNQLLCMIKLFQKNVMHSTPSFIYFFAKNETLSVEERATLHKLDPYRLHILPLDERHWTNPYLEQILAPRETWRSARFDEDFRRVGHWRLTFQMAFARRLGHRYVMAIDDDTFVKSEVNYNIVSVFAQDKILIASRHLIPDDSEWEVGLAELTRYYLITSGIEPTQLYEHCIPQSIEGVFTRIPRAGTYRVGWQRTLPELWNKTYTESVKFIGWKSQLIYANFYVIDLDFWYQEEVQRYLRLIIGSGGHYKERWNEQGVMTMIWLLFAPKGGFRLFNFSTTHKEIDAKFCNFTL